MLFADEGAPVHGAAQIESPDRQIHAARVGDGGAFVQIVRAKFLLIEPGANELHGGVGIELKGQHRFGLNELAGGGGDHVVRSAEWTSSADVQRRQRKGRAAGFAFEDAFGGQFPAIRFGGGQGRCEVLLGINAPCCKA